MGDISRIWVTPCVGQLGFHRSSFAHSIALLQTTMNHQQSQSSGSISAGHSFAVVPAVPQAGQQLVTGSQAARDWLSKNFREDMRTGDFESVWQRLSGCPEGLMDQVLEVASGQWLGRSSYYSAFRVPGRLSCSASCSPVDIYSFAGAG